MRNSAWLLLTLGLAAISLAGCTDLPDLTPNTCGNGVLEPGEDCDSNPVDGVLCLTDAVHGCHLSCAVDGGGGGRCPSGWGCGVDTICRRPSGSFAMGSKVEDPSRRLLVGDFNGDGRTDLVLTGEDQQGLVSSSPLVSYSTAQGLSSPVAAGYSLVLPAVADLDGDGRDDLAVGTASLALPSTLSNLAVLQGTAGAQLLPRVFSTALPKDLGRPLIVHGSQATLSGNLMLRLQPSDTAGSTDLVERQKDGTDALVATYPKAYGDLAVQVGRAPYYVPIPNPYNVPPGCDAVALAFHGDARVWVQSICENTFPVFANSSTDPSGGSSSGGGGSMSWEEALPEGDVVNNGVFLVDLNSDGAADLLISGVAATWVAFGDGAGGFNGIPDQPGSAPVKLELTEVQGSTGSSGVVTTGGGLGTTGTNGTDGTTSDFGTTGDSTVGGTGGDSAGSGNAAGGTGGGPPPPPPVTGTDAGQPDAGPPAPDGGDNPEIGDTLLAVGVLDNRSLVILRGSGIIRTEYFFTPNSYYGTTVAQATYQSLAERSVVRWDKGLIADLNGDGLLDVVAASSSQRDIDLFVQVNSLLNHATLTTQSPVVAMTSGDFDGDGVNDLAYAERKGGTDSVKVAYGRSRAVPGAPLEVARPGEVSRLEPADFDGLTTRVDLLGVVEAGAKERQVVWSGEDQLRMTSAFPLTCTQPAAQALPVLIAAGRFAGSGNPKRLAALGVDLSGLLASGTSSLADSTLALWGVDLDHGVAQPSADLTGLALLSGNTSAQGYTLGAQLLAGDLDGVDGDELLLLSARQDGDGALVIAHPNNGTFSIDTPLPFKQTLMPFAPDSTSQMALLDVNLDGLNDLIVLARKRPEISPATLGQQVLLYCQNKADSAFPVDDCIDVSPPGMPVTSIGVLRTLTGPRVVALTEQGLWMSQPFSSTSALSFSPVHVPNAPDGTALQGVALAVGDADGDGLDDLFVGDGQNVTLWLGVKVTP